MKILNAVLSVTCLCLLTLTLLPVPATAQPPEGEMPPEMAAMMEALEKAGTPGEPHEWLAKSAGSYKMTVKAWMAPGVDPEINDGTAEREMILGGRYLTERVSSTAMGMPFEGFALTGYDNVTGKYWGIWVDTFTTGLMTMTGERDGNTLTWTATSSNPMTGGPVEMKMVGTLHDDGTETVEFFENPGDQEIKSMEIVYEPK